MNVGGFRDSYSVLGVGRNADVKEIAKAYRKKALECHPDKNVEQTSEATKRFHLLREAYDILLDPQAKAALDAVLDAKMAVEMRNKYINVERAIFRDELLGKEQRAREAKAAAKQAEQVLQTQVERLRRERVGIFKEDPSLWFNETFNEESKSFKEKIVRQGDDLRLMSEEQFDALERRVLERLRTST